MQKGVPRVKFPFNPNVICWKLCFDKLFRCSDEFFLGVFCFLFSGGPIFGSMTIEWPRRPRILPEFHTAFRVRTFGHLGKGEVKVVWQE